MSARMLLRKSYGDSTKDEGKESLGQKFLNDDKAYRFVRAVLIVLVVIVLLYKVGGGDRSKLQVGLVYHRSEVPLKSQTSEMVELPPLEVEETEASAVQEERQQQQEEEEMEQKEEDIAREEATRPDLDEVFENIPVVEKKSQLFMGHRNTGWTVDTRCLEKKSNVVVYAVGCGEDISWDLGMANRFDNINMFLFDPTPKSIKYMKPILEKHRAEKDNIVLTTEGLSTEKGVLTFTKPRNPDFVSMREGVHTKNEDSSRVIKVPVNTLKNWMNKHGHTYLDVFKIDIEGSEYDVLQQLIDEKYLPFTQLLIEFHDRWLKKPSEKAKHKKVWKGLKELGFVPFSRTHNNQEVSFIKARDLPYCLGANIERSPWADVENKVIISKPAPVVSTSSQESSMDKIDKSDLLYMGNRKTNTGWVVAKNCLENQDPSRDIVVYGVGAGMDITWDIGMQKRFGAKVFVFDPTAKSIAYVTPLQEKHGFTFTAEGLSDNKGTLTFTLPKNKEFVSMRSGVHTKNEDRVVKLPVNTLKNWMARFNHTYLDVLKIDIEGSEYPVLQQLIDEEYLPFTQLLVEFHQRWFNTPEEKKKHTRILDGLKRLGFVKTHSKHGQEISFIKKKDIPFCYNNKLIRTP